MATKVSIKIKPIYQWHFSILVAFAMILVAALSLLIYNNVTVDYFDKLQSLTQEEGHLKDQIYEKHSSIKKVPLYMEKLAQLNELESTVDNQFPNDAEIPNMLIEVNQLAEQSNVAINNMMPSVDEQLVSDPSSNTNDQSVAKIWSRNFSVTATCSPSGLIDFIYSVAKFSRVMQIKDINISRISDDSINVSMIITIFYLK